MCGSDATPKLVAQLRTSLSRESKRAFRAKIESVKESQCEQSCCECVCGTHTHTRAAAAAAGACATRVANSTRLGTIQLRCRRLTCHATCARKRRRNTRFGSLKRATGRDREEKEISLIAQSSRQAPPQIECCRITMQRSRRARRPPSEASTTLLPRPDAFICCPQRLAGSRDTYPTCLALNLALDCDVSRWGGRRSAISQSAAPSSGGGGGGG